MLPDIIAEQRERQRAIERKIKEKMIATAISTIALGLLSLAVDHDFIDEICDVDYDSVPDNNSE